MITTIIFDFAGVVSTEQFGGWKKISDKFGLKPDKVKEYYYAHVEEYGRGGVGSTQKFLNNVCGGFDVKLKEFESIYSNWWSLNKDVVSLIENLKNIIRSYFILITLTPVLRRCVLTKNSIVFP